MLRFPPHNGIHKIVRVDNGSLPYPVAFPRRWIDRRLLGEYRDLAADD